MFDYTKLIKLIRMRFDTQGAFAKVLGIGRVSLNQRLNNHLNFTNDEIAKAADLLGIAKEDIPEYFFTEKVQKNELE